MSRILIWPDMYKERGHWLPTFSMAKALQLNGHTVEYMGIKDCASIVDDYGFTFHPIFEKLYPAGHSLENDLEPKTQRWKPHHILPLARGEGGLDEILAEVDDDDQPNPNRPDIIVSGYFTALETLLLHYKYNIPFVMLTSYLRHPDEDPFIRAKSQLLHMSRAMSTQIMDTVNPPEPGEENVIREFVQPLVEYPEIIPCPQVFDFDKYKHSANVSYVEPMITPVPDNPDPGTSPPTLDPGTKIIFASAGSMVEDYLFKAKDFFQKMIAMMSTSGMENWHLILSVGAQLIEDFQDVNLPNVSIYKWVSQTEVLAKDDMKVVFTHGGLATLKESMFNGVPVVIVPLGKDQMDNALRVKQHKVGLLADLQVVSVDKLKMLMTEVTTSPWISKRVADMQVVFEDAEEERPSVAIIEAVLAGPPVV